MPSKEISDWWATNKAVWPRLSALVERAAGIEIFFPPPAPDVLDSALHFVSLLTGIVRFKLLQFFDRPRADPRYFQQILQRHILRVECVFIQPIPDSFPFLFRDIRRATGWEYVLPIPVTVCHDEKLAQSRTSPP